MKTAKQVDLEVKRLSVRRDAEIDTSEVAEVIDWSSATKGQFYRPVKQQVTLRIDADVLAWFKAKGGKYQTELNKVLREHMLRGRKRV
jgi:uncharacterized protein (DUF4415 family)